MKIKSSLPLAVITIAILSGCAGMTPSAPIGVAELKPTQGNNVTGTTTFVQQGNKIMVDARVKGLTPGAHGFHIHEKGDCSAPDATSAGAHFNPAGKAHGAHEGDNRHGGDLGNLVADANGNAVLKLSIAANDVGMEKGSPNSIIGRGLIIHADPDDYKTQPTGNSGKRVACGVISMK